MGTHSVQNYMRLNRHVLKGWAALFVAVTPFVAAFGSPDTNTIPTRSSREPHIPATNRGGTTNFLHEGHGWLGLVISGAPEGAVVERVVIGGPAWQCGMRSGDVIVATDRGLLAGLSLPTIAKLLRQPVGSELGLSISRAGQKQLLHFKAKRELVRPSPEGIDL
jgi:C-terminal processing protease CtpA/Prc